MASYRHPLCEGVKDGDGARDPLQCPGFGAEGGHQKDVKSWLSFLHNRTESRHGSELKLMNGVRDWHRIVCVDWLAEVSNAFQLKHITLTRAVALFDQAVAVMAPSRGQLQKFAITCLVMSGKMEETFSINLKEFASMTCGVCSKAEIMETEMSILCTTGFRVVTPSVSDFLYPLMTYLGVTDPATVATAECVAEATLYSVACSSLPRNLVAASVISVATSTELDTEITAATKELFGTEDWENARVAVTEASEECYLNKFDKWIENHASELSFATKKRHCRALGDKRSRDDMYSDEEDEEDDDDDDLEQEQDPSSSPETSLGHASSSSLSQSTTYSCLRKKRRHA